MGWQDSIAQGSTDTTDELLSPLTILTKLTISGDGSVTQIRWWQNDGFAIGNSKMFVYDNSTPRLLLGSASPASNSLGGTPGYLERPLNSPFSVVNGQVVWLGINCDTSGAFDARYLNGGASNAAYQFEAYSSSPSSPWTEEGTLTRTYAAGIFLEPASGTGFLLVCN
jgi:hypothetical protein